MNRYARFFFILVPAIFCNTLFAQTNTYQLNGSATQNSCNCYTLTTETLNQSASVWNKYKISLTDSFDFYFNVFLGCKDSDGADGIAFVLQPISTSVGTTGGGMGYEGITPSVAVTLDTWQNFINNDPAYDHISIETNGKITHFAGTDLADPIPISATSDNVEDCQWHVLRVTWNPVTQWMRTYFDGVLRVQAQYDIVGKIFNNDPNVYWGFTAATGGDDNVQKFCTALNPKFKTDLPTDTACLNATVNFQNGSESFAPITKYYWDFGDGTTSTTETPPTHNYSKPGVYNVKLAITGKDGCNSDTLMKIIAIGSKPTANFNIYDTCFHSSPRIKDRSTNNVGAINQWNWTLNGTPVATGQQPRINNIPVGSNQLQLNVASVYGCASDTIAKSFVIKDIPQITATVKDGCAHESVSFNATQTDTKTTITQWYWNFGDGQNAAGQNTTHTYGNPDTYHVQTWALANNGCTSDTVSNPLLINQSFAFAGNDTIVLKNVPFQLHAKGAGAFQWSPSTGLSNDAIADPTVVLNDDQTYLLTVTTAEGCVATDTINITVFKGSAVYVPNAFTPNGDGLNDILRPKYIGIKTLDYFTIYNRWGQRVFFTNNTGAGWDGTINGTPASTGTYVWMLRAIDIPGKVYQLKGTVTIIR